MYIKSWELKSGNEKSTEEKDREKTDIGRQPNRDKQTKKLITIGKWNEVGEREEGGTD